MTNRRKSFTPDAELDDLEAHLAGTLRPISPPMEILQRVRGRIQMPSRSEITLRLSDWRRLFFVFSGVVSGMLLLITLARAFYYFADRRG
ncbi:MAG: hypothetical protein HYZ23_02470 [Chloroflexi bacterium]|nr:hypothetical protein [Chloroflexota bacterium]